MSYFFSGFVVASMQLVDPAPALSSLKAPRLIIIITVFFLFFFFFIIDVDECTASSPMCHENAFCKNTPGSYNCTCKPGYYGDGKTCRGKIGRCLHHSSFQSLIARDVTTWFVYLIRLGETREKPECSIKGVGRNDIPHLKFFKCPWDSNTLPLKFFARRSSKTNSCSYYNWHINVVERILCFIFFPRINFMFVKKGTKSDAPFLQTLRGVPLSLGVKCLF